MNMISALSSISATTPLDRAAPRTQATDAASGASFGDVLKQLTSEAAESVKGAESTAIAGMQGQASVQQVVDSMMSAERSLQTMIAVRDKAVGAYQEISKMAI
jgi:flagellar hook-basal body complex protein FliE